MIDIAKTLSGTIRDRIPDATISIPGDGAIMVGGRDELLMFQIRGSQLIVPSWVYNRNVFRSTYDLANQEDLEQFVSSVKLALES